jgi:hypothetical protein
MMPRFDLPPSIARALISLLAFGFPVAVTFAWVHELVPALAAGDAGAVMQPL